MKTWEPNLQRALHEENISQSYLYEGTGDPWAGQARLNGFLDSSFRLELVSLPENFGVDPPTGSITHRMVKKTNWQMDWGTLWLYKRENELK